MGGQIDWAAMPVVCEMLGIEDVELLIYQMIVIRDQPND